MLVDLSVTIMHVNISVAVIQLEVSAAPMQVTVSASNMWVTIFIVYMFYAGGSLCCSYVVHFLQCTTVSIVKCRLVKMPSTNRL